MKIKFDKDSLAVEPNDYLSKIVVVYFVYDLDAWPEILLTILNLRIVYLEELV